MTDLTDKDYKEFFDKLSEYILWIDDDKIYRDPYKPKPFCNGDTWRQRCFPEHTYSLPLVWVNDYDGFVQVVEERGLPVAISFDNDLGEGMEGKHAAKWLLNYCIDNGLSVPEFNVHSANPIAAKEIYKILKDDYGKYLELSRVIDVPPDEGGQI